MQQQVTTSKDAAVINVQGLKFAYKKASSDILDIAGFRIERNQHVFLHGPSGTGKTTLLSILAGLLVPRAGNVQILGRELFELSGPERDHFRGAHLGYIFQMFNLIPYLNVKQNIELPLNINVQRAKRLHAPRQQVITELAERLGIADLLDRPVTELSVGQQQRVAAARALIGDPDLVIADEPTSALDTNHREGFLATMFAAAERSKSSILFVSHDHTLKPLFKHVLSLAELNRANHEKPSK